MSLLKSLLASVLIVLTAFFIMGTYAGIRAWIGTRRYSFTRPMWTELDGQFLKAFAVGMVLCAAALWSLLF